MFKKRKLYFLVCLILFMSAVLPGTFTLAEDSVIVTADHLNIRKGPGLDYSVIAKAQKGKSYQISKVEEEWLEIYFDSNRTGWIHRDYTKSNEMAEETATTGVVKASTLNIRAEPSLNSKSIGKLSKGEVVTILTEKNEWLEISFNQKQGWIAGWYVEKKQGKLPPPTTETIKDGEVTINHNGTNIRSAPDLNAKVVERANAGDSYPIIGIHQDWYEIKRPDGKSGFVAGWIVSVSKGVRQVEKNGSHSTIKFKKIMIDPGHGGNDRGATGMKGTIEKDLTMKTGQAIYEKLKAKGVHAILTRSDDQYLSLSTRVSMAHYKDVDAFISLHYDSIDDHSVRGMTTYYYHDNQKELATTLHRSTIARTGLKNRDARFGDYHVIRENRANSVLLELGFISHPTEELLLNTDYFQEQVATGIVQGLENYFNQ